MTRIRLYHALLPALLVVASLLLAGCGNGGGY
jgi:predicted small secreted protein